MASPGEPEGETREANSFSVSLLNMGDVAFGGAKHDGFGIVGDALPAIVELLEGERLDSLNDVAHRRLIEWDEVGIAVHEANIALIGYSPNGIAGKDGSLARRCSTPVQDGAARKMAATVYQRAARDDLICLSIPEVDGLI